MVERPRRSTRYRQRDFPRQTVWEGTVHVFDLEGHPKATRPYAWSSPVDGSKNVGSMPTCTWAGYGRRWTSCGWLTAHTAAKAGDPCYIYTV